jgi:phosphoglucomutase
MAIHPLAGKPAPPESLVNLAALMADYYTLSPAAPVSFGTSGHRGRAGAGSFNEAHVAAVVAAVLEHRKLKGYKGPIFLGYDTHALSEGAFRTALSVLAGHGAPVVASQGQEYTPTPVISWLILGHNRQHPQALADGLIITPSHNPPQDGGIKYNPPHGGPADVEVTSWIEKRAGELLDKAGDIARLPFQKAMRADSVTFRDFVRPFVEDLGQVVDLPAIKAAGLKLGADPLGGSGARFWGPIAERWGLDLEVVNKILDPSFSFMPLDADGVIRMDCSSPYAMARLIALGGKFDLAFGNDPDFDRHGIVSGGALMNPNHFLAASIHYLSGHRPGWKKSAKIGKTLVSSSLIDRAAAGAGREIFETPVGFKWFVPGLLSGDLAFGGEESAGATFLRLDGSPWTTDKCGFCMALLSAEMMAATGRAPHEIYGELSERYGAPSYRRLDSDLTEEAKGKLLSLSPESLVGRDCAGAIVTGAVSRASGNQAPIGGIKVSLADGSWFAIRPSGTEPKMKLYLESLSGPDFLEPLAQAAEELVFGG